MNSIFKLAKQKHQNIEQLKHSQHIPTTFKLWSWLYPLLIALRPHHRLLVPLLYIRLMQCSAHYLNELSKFCPQTNQPPLKDLLVWPLIKASFCYVKWQSRDWKKYARISHLWILKGGTSELHACPHCGISETGSLFLKLCLKINFFKK